MVTDSATVQSWLRSVLTDSHKVRTHGLAEMLVKRRLSMVSELVEIYNLRLTVQFVPSAENKADVLTRVPRDWLRPSPSTGQCAVAAAQLPSVQEIHEQHHFGVRRTLHLARQVHPQTTRKQVEQMVRDCVRCARIDPAPVRWHNGRLEVSECWTRLAVDVTHHGRDKYLSMIECGPSRFTIWRRIPNEDASVLVGAIESILVEFGPPVQILLDNSTSFR